MSLLRALALGTACVLFAAAGARAEDPLNSNEKPTNTDAPAGIEALKSAPHNEGNFLPTVAASTDIGVGGGYFANLAHLHPPDDPYVWDLESAGLITFKPGPSGGFDIPYADLYFKLTIPRLFGLPLRMELRPSFTSEAVIRYYGIGNGSTNALPAGKNDAYTEFGRTHPQIDLDLRFKILDHLSGRAGARYIQNWIQISPDSKLAFDMQNGSAEVKSLLGTGAPHAVILLKTGLVYDTRDNEASTYSGMLDTIDLRFSPGGNDSTLRYRYEETTVNLRVFVPVRQPWITFAARLVGSGYFGDVPFYELARFDDTYAMGGTNGVRGVPAGRFYGKAKLFGNIELRNEVATFRALDKPLVFGIVGFFDAGRVWTDWGQGGELDGSGLGIHYGTGIGFRLQSGSAFVLRADIAWSPDATPIGAYFSAGQLF